MHDPIAALLGPWTVELNTGSVALRLALSLVISAIIGYERSSKRHSAGLRTFIIVSLAATTAAILEIYFFSLGSTSPWISAGVIEALP